MEVHEQPNVIANPTDDPFKMPSTPGTPLQQISPERLNQRLIHSPSLPMNLDPSSRKTQHRLSDASDVRARIAMLNSISQQGSPVRSTSPTKLQPSLSSNAAIQRAILGREEAESMLSAMAAQLESGKARERLVAERVESLMEQLTEARSRQRHERQVYEKEIRISKKCEYKAELAFIKMQEELKEVKSELESVKARADHDKAEKERARQEAFERAYVIAGVTEEIQTLKEQLKVMEQERDNAVAMAASRLAAEEKRQAETIVSECGVPQMQPENAQEGKEEQPSPNMLRSQNGLIFISDQKEQGIRELSVEIKYEALQRQIIQLESERKENQELIHFMNMQCQFQTCPCRMAERNGVRFVHDHEYDQRVYGHASKKRKVEAGRSAPKQLSWMQKMQLKKSKQANADTVEVFERSQEISVANEDHVKDQMPAAHATIHEEEQNEVAAPLPPLSYDVNQMDVSEQIAEVDEAAQIPLPPAASTPDDTAQLEEITQVIVQPGPSSQPFSFSTSMSSVSHIINPTLKKHNSQDAVPLSDELFDLSPPKHMLARPSTALGILTVESPIRLVPESPLPPSAQHEQDSGTLTQSQTIRVALNDTSPVRQARSHHRSQSRNDVHQMSRGHSPAAEVQLQTTAEKSRPASALDTASPTSSTFFPITPVMKHPRTKEQSRTQPRAHNLQKSYSQPQTNNEYQTTGESRTTTTIPLRDESELELPPVLDQNQTTNGASSINHPSLSALRDPLANVPGTPITREAALAQIRARRDRARSVNMRNRSEDMHPDGGERKGAKTPGSVARRGIKIDLSSRLGLSDERGREVSQASAPGRF